MDLAHSEITLAGAKIDLPPLKLGQIRRIKDAVVRGREQKREGLDVIDTGIEILCIALGRKEDEIEGSIPEIDVATQEILKFAGFSVPGEKTGAPAATQTTDGDSSTGA